MKPLEISKYFNLISTDFDLIFLQSESSLNILLTSIRLS